MSTRRILAIVGITSLLVLLIALGTARLVDASASGAAAWIEAFATLAAFAAAVTAALLVMRTVQIELAREKERQDTLKRSQAALVAAWATDLGKVRGKQDESTGSVPVVGISSVRVCLRNASDIPVTDVTVLVKVRVKEMVDDSITTIGHSDGSASMALLAPAAETEMIWVVLEEPIMFPGAPYVDDMIERTVTFAFTDAAGHRWVRDHGVLK